MDKYFLDVNDKYYDLCHGISTLEVKTTYDLLELLYEMNHKLNINTLMIQKSGEKFYVRVDEPTKLFYSSIKKDF